MIQKRLFIILSGAICLTAMVASATLSAATVSYGLAMPKPSSHLFEVTMRIEGVKRPEVDVAMPAWAPGSYFITNAGRNVQEFSATDGGGGSLLFEKTDKQTWRITRGKDATVVVRYKYYAGPSMSPLGTASRLTQLDSSQASVTGPNVFMYVVGKSPYPLEGPVSLTIEAPPGWRVYSPLKKGGGAIPFLLTTTTHLSTRPLK